MQILFIIIIFFIVLTLIKSPLLLICLLAVLGIIAGLGASKR